MSTTPLLDWEGPILPRHPRPTQEQAALRIKYALSGLRQTVLRAIQDATDRGTTDSELQTMLDMDGNTERPRRKELEMAGYIRDSGTTRLNRRGNQEIVWVAI